MQDIEYYLSYNEQNRFDQSEQVYGFKFYRTLELHKDRRDGMDSHFVSHIRTTT